MVRDYWKVIALVTLLQTLVNYSLFYHGLKLVPGAIGAVIVGSQPLVTAVVASMMHSEDILTPKKVATVISGLAGVILISAGRQAFNFGTASELLGIAMILGANAALSVSNVIVSVKSKGLNPLVLSSSSLFIGGVILYLVSIPVEGKPSVLFPAEYWIVLAWLSIMAAVAFSIWFKLLQRPGVKVSELNLWKFIIPVVGAILSWLIVPDEHPEWITVTGMIIIITSLVLFNTNFKAQSGKNLV
jgi:drug/metabolite transporter (DMT)-like permease